MIIINHINIFLKIIFHHLFLHFFLFYFSPYYFLLYHTIIHHLFCWLVTTILSLSFHPYVMIPIPKVYPMLHSFFISEFLCEFSFFGLHAFLIEFFFIFSYNIIDLISHYRTLMLSILTQRSMPHTLKSMGGVFIGGLKVFKFLLQEVKMS